MWPRAMAEHSSSSGLWSDAAGAEEYATSTATTRAAPSATAESVFDSSITEFPMIADTHGGVYEAFNILEIIMTSLELTVWMLAAIKMPRWRRNYRNQMLMEISVARFLKRVILSLMFLHKCSRASATRTCVAAHGAQTYIDLVIVTLVFFLVRHMYDSLITVVVTIRQNGLYRVSLWAWAAPAPVAALWAALVVCDVLDQWTVYLLVCCMFRWPLMLAGSAVYATVLYRVLSDRIRKFARSLTVVTFLMCLFINFYLLLKDVIRLWCLSWFRIELIGYVSGFVVNLLIVSFYVILITLDYSHCSRPPPAFDTKADYSLADTGCKVSHLDEHD